MNERCSILFFKGSLDTSSYAHCDLDITSSRSQVLGQTRDSLKESIILLNAAESQRRSKQRFQIYICIKVYHSFSKRHRQLHNLIYENVGFIKYFSALCFCRAGWHLHCIVLTRYMYMYHARKMLYWNNYINVDFSA